MQAADLWNVVESWIVARAPVLLALLALLALVVVQTLRLWWERSRAARRMRRNHGLGKDAEARASGLLRKYGYRVTATQCEVCYRVLVDGQPMSVHIRADFLVKKANETFVAEVKAGEESAKLTRSTRRQLLEYTKAYRIDGVLLVDMHSQRVRKVEFP